MDKLTAVQIRRNVLRFIGFDLPDQMLDDVSKIHTDGEKITITTKVSINPKHWRGVYRSCVAMLFILVISGCESKPEILQENAVNPVVEWREHIQEVCGIDNTDLMTEAYHKIDICIRKLQFAAKECQ